MMQDTDSRNGSSTRSSLAAEVKQLAQVDLLC